MTLRKKGEKLIHTFRNKFKITEKHYKTLKIKKYKNQKKNQIKFCTKLITRTKNFLFLS